MSLSFAVIFNPRSGKKKKEDFLEIFVEKFSKLPYEIFIWDENQKFEKIENEILSKKFNVIIAAGGDGTVNKVASFVLENDLILGIIPLGSGNGLARSINIGTDTIRAIEKIKLGFTDSIDSGKINDKNFFCTAGVGFDAHIGNLFASSTKRGLWIYIKITISELLSFVPKLYEVRYNEKSFFVTAFLITVCNAGQWGNNIFIAPEAKINDGVLNMIVLKKFPWYAAPYLTCLLLLRSIQNSKYSKSLTGKKFIIRSGQPLNYHYDGEPGISQQEIVFQLNEKKLKVIC